MVFLEAIQPTFVVYFSLDLDDFIWRLRVKAPPIVPRTARPIIELGSGIETGGTGAALAGLE